MGGSTITVKNSPLWKVNVELQLAYHTTRSWARLYAPEVLLGIYTPDEVADGAQANMEAKTLPGTAPAPDRRSFDDSGAVDAEVEEIAQNVESRTESTVEPENPAEKAENAPQAEEKTEKQPQMDLDATIPVRICLLRTAPASQQRHNSDTREWKDSNRHSS